MVTMKDVAKHAGVSVSTVSNIVNGLKSVNSDIVKKVELSMKELGYIPNAKAQGLRSKKSNTIGVILPDINDPIYSDILLGIENTAKLNGYNIQLYITGDIPEFEIDAIAKLQNQQAEVVIISSCMPTNVQYIQKLITNQIKIVFVRRKPLDFIEGSFVTIDEYANIYRCMEFLSKKEINSASLITLDKNYSNEHDSERAFRDGCAKFGINIVNIANLKLGKEPAFKTTSWWMQGTKIPDVIITTNPKSKDGSMASIKFFTNDKCPLVITTDSSSWTNDIYEDIDDILTQNFYSLGLIACNKALSLIKAPNELSNEIIVLPNKIINEKIPFPKLNKKKLKMLLLKNSTSYASSILVDKFSQNTNLDIQLTTVNCLDNATLQDYDIIQIHQPLMKTLIENNEIECLNNTTLPNQLMHNFSANINQIYSQYQQNFYAVPYIADCQLLYYRKDLFESLHLQRLYYETYKQELVPPTSFKEYNQIVQFFTKEFNNESPVEYGNVISGDISSLVFNFFPRLWELLGHTTTNFHGAGKGLIKAVLTNLAEAFSYCPKNAITFEPFKQIEYMNKGNAGMMISCQTAYLDYVNSLFTSSNENIYSATIPSKYSVRTGFSLAITKDSTVKDEAIAFLQWFLSDHVCLSNNLLGGTIPSEYVIASNELSLTNPWLNITCQNINQSVDILKYEKGALNSIFELELGIIIQNYLQHLITIEEATNGIYDILNP